VRLPKNRKSPASRSWSGPFPY